MTSRDEEAASRQTLLVSWERRDEARRMGARWDPDVRAWTIGCDGVDDVPRDMLPLRDRPGVAAPFIRINLIPQTSWGRNLRSLMERDEWKAFARRHVYGLTGSLCLVCGGRGPDWPVEADEVWHFDDDAGIQRLAAVVPLCPACHEVRSAGLATANGRGEDAARHLAWVDRTRIGDARKRIADAMHVWQTRSRRTWQIDLTVMQERYGIEIRHEQCRTQATNAELVEKARARRRGRGDGGGMTVDGLLRHLYGGH